MSQMPPEQKKKVKKLLFLYQGESKRIETELRLRREGTPVEQMVDDVPSPPPQKNSKSMSLLKDPTFVENDTVTNKKE